MSKLTRTVAGQTITFLALPRIFQSLSVDLPTGAIKLSTGEVAYWRLNRNLTELKNNRSSHRTIAETLAQALRSLVMSEAFMNHYGLAKSPELPNEANLSTTFRALLALNNTRTDYTSTYYGRNKPLIETITVPLSNMVYFNATRGSTTPPPRQAGLKGTLWLNSKTTEGEVPFRFTIASPHVLLPNHINEERLSKEILTKIIQNLPIMVSKPTIEFDDGQFESYIGSGLQALVEKTAHAPNGASKKKGALVKSPVAATPQPAALIAEVSIPAVWPGSDPVVLETVLGPDAYASLSSSEQSAYLERMALQAKLEGPEADKLRADFMFSGILEKEWKESCADVGGNLVVQSHEYFLGCVLGLAESAIANAITLKQIGRGMKESKLFNEADAEATAQVFDAIADAALSVENIDKKVPADTNGEWLKESFARAEPTPAGFVEAAEQKIQNSGISGSDIGSADAPAVAEATEADVADAIVDEVSETDVDEVAVNTVTEKAIGWKFWVHGQPNTAVALAFDDKAFVPGALADGETAFVKLESETEEEFHIRAKQSLADHCPEGYEVVGIEMVAGFDDNGNMVNLPTDYVEQAVAVSESDVVVDPAGDGDEAAPDTTFKLPA